MATYLEKFKRASALNRRSFVRAGAAATVALAAGGSLVACSSPQEDDLAATGDGATPETGGTWVTAACWHNCGGRCLNKALVEDGVILRQKTDDTHEDSQEFPQQRGCLRGRAIGEMAFGADRIKYPLKRKGWQPGGKDFHPELRGRDEWERISWDEAIR